jgi:hypothetical protein
VACFSGCAEVTGLADYDDAVAGERLFGFDGSAELASWHFEGCSYERSFDVGGQNPGALRLSPTAEPCVASATLSTQRDPDDYAQLAVWFRSASYDTITLGLNGVNNRVVVCSPETTIDSSACTITPDQGSLTDGVLQLVDLSDLVDAGVPVARGEITQLTITLPPAEAGKVTLYVDDVWLK